MGFQREIPQKENQDLRIKRIRKRVSFRTSVSLSEEKRRVRLRIESLLCCINPVFFDEKRIPFLRESLKSSKLRFLGKNGSKSIVARRWDLKSDKKAFSREKW